MNTVDTCEQFQSLISAELDGELDVREQAELQGHLAECAVCLRWQVTANRLAHQLASIDEVEGEQSVPIHANGHARPLVELAPKESVANFDDRPTVRRSATWFWAAAALLFISVGISFGVRARRESPIPTVSVEPLVAMHAINVQTEHDQQAVLRNVEMDLRMMKLEMRSMDLDPASRQQLGDRIESLLAKTRQLDASTPISYRGELP